jgi:hypothetical protein
MKKILVTYADNSEPLVKSQQALIAQSKPFVNGYAAFNKQTLDKDFYVKNKHILDQTRGGGYWLWKPFIIHKVLNLVSDGDYVLYLDSGTAIVGDLNLLFKASESVGDIMLFENRDGNPLREVWINKLWTKRDCFIKLNCDAEHYHNGPQCVGGIQLYKKTPTSLKFVQEYYEMCQDESVITDSPSRLGNNFKEFIDHRHDQSVLSLLALKHNIKLQPNPSETGEGTRPKGCTYQTLVWHHRGTIYGRR